jgi:hypothetical protein
MNWEGRGRRKHPSEGPISPLDWNGVADSLPEHLSSASNGTAEGIKPRLSLPYIKITDRQTED